MPRISVFAEDYGHEAFLRPVLERIAAEYDVPVTVTPFSVRGGFGKVAEELKEYVRDLLGYRENLPDLVIVATDANCEGFKKRRKQFQETAEPIHDRLVFAVPDPHVERWLLLDSAAFKQVLGKACTAPDQKCNRDRYKSLLARAVVDSGATPLLGGMEYAEDIVRAMDFDRVQREDESLGALLEELHSRFRAWHAAPQD
jgi:hypothetical protein